MPAVFSLVLWACGSQGGPTGGGDFVAAIRCPVCGVGTYTIDVGDVAQLFVEATSVSTGGEVACPLGTWITSSPGVATVVGTGKTATVTGVGAGLVTITADLVCDGQGEVSVNADILVVSSDGAGASRGGEGGE